MKKSARYIVVFRSRRVSSTRRRRKPGPRTTTPILKRAISKGCRFRATGGTWRRCFANCSTAPPCTYGRSPKIGKAAVRGRRRSGRSRAARASIRILVQTEIEERSRSWTTSKCTHSAIDRNDRVYAATFARRQGHRLNAAGKAEVFFDPKAKYIWGLAFDSHGDLFVATGDRGEIYKVAPSGKGGGVLQDLGDARSQLSGRVAG